MLVAIIVSTSQMQYIPLMPKISEQQFVWGKRKRFLQHAYFVPWLSTSLYKVKQGYTSYSEETRRESPSRATRMTTGGMTCEENINQQFEHMPSMYLDNFYYHLPPPSSSCFKGTEIERKLEWRTC